MDDFLARSRGVARGILVRFLTQDGHIAWDLQEMKNSEGEWGVAFSVPEGRRFVSYINADFDYEEAIASAEPFELRFSERGILARRTALAILEKATAKDCDLKPERQAEWLKKASEFMAIADEEGFNLKGTF